VENKCESAYLICFAGASVKSRQWPVENWIEFIKTYSKLADAPAIVLAGGPGDIPFIDQIVAATDVESIAGKVNLIEMAGWIKHAEATISNDTMAAHLSVALNRPTVMVCSGDNFFKFSAYRDAGVSGVVSLFPEAFEKEWRKKGKKNFRNYMAVSRDIGTIQPEAVQAALQSLIISG
jgi:ADP-heptose:LPS heptosyltransferase